MSSYGPLAMPPAMGGSSITAAARVVTAHAPHSSRNMENRLEPICRSNARKRYSRNHEKRPSARVEQGTSEVNRRYA